MKVKVDISIVIPIKDEGESLIELHNEIVSSLTPLKKNYEIIFVDDGSIDDSLNILKSIRKKNPNVLIISHRGNFGKSIALKNGFNIAKGEIVFTMDADLQDNPKEIPKFLNKLSKGYDMVSGWKKIRHDPFSKTFPSKIGNLLTRLLTRVPVHDLNCGFKAYKKEVIDNIDLYGELYKYIPVLAQKENFKIGEIIVEHRARKWGKSKFGWQRNIKGFLDMLTIVFLTGYLKRPAHFFGTFGILSFGSGFIIGLYITYLRITTGSIQYRQPLLFLGMLLMIIGIQLITTGLLAEMLLNLNQNNSKHTSIKEVII